MEGEDKVGVRELYANVTEDIRFAKRQQWTVAYYVLLVHAGIAGFYRLVGGEKVDVAEPQRFLMTLLAIAATLIAVYYLGIYQDWLRGSRRRLRRIYEGHASEGFVAARGGTAIRAGFFKDWEILLGLSLLLTASAALVTWYVMQDQAYAAKVFLGLLALSVAILLFLKVYGRKEP